MIGLFGLFDRHPPKAPNRGEKGAYDGADYHTGSAEQCQAPKGRHHNKQVGHFGVLPDEQRAQQVVRGADNDRAPQADTYGRPGLPVEN